jgi:predicted nucleic acid-binding protein
MTYLTDSTYVIHFLRGQAYARMVYPTLIRDGLALSIITHMEVWEGVYAARDPRGAERLLQAFLKPLTILPFSRRVSQRTARLRRQLRTLRRPIDQRALDILIAGTALNHGLTMVTSDGDFDDILGLAILDPRTGATKQNPA